MFSPETPRTATFPMDRLDVPPTLPLTSTETKTPSPDGMSCAPGVKKAPACCRTPVVFASAMAPSSPRVDPPDTAIGTAPLQAGPTSRPVISSLKTRAGMPA